MRFRSRLHASLARCALSSRPAADISAARCDSEPPPVPSIACSQPQQLSTYALTLFPYEAEVDGRKVSVGAPPAGPPVLPRPRSRRRRR